nr:MAG TPA: adenine-specific methyltransferase [Caudoviricetes sp.]
MSGNNRKDDAATNDYYATEPRAVEILLDHETFSKDVWEPACGEGHISKVLLERGYDVLSTDLVYRGFGFKTTVDFLNKSFTEADDIDIITTPYKYAREFVEKSLQCVGDGHEVAMLLKLTFLDGVFNRKNNAVAYAWFVWEKGFQGDPIVRWVN